MQTAPAKSSLAHFSPHLAPHEDGPIKVRAVMRGYYGNTLRHPGAIFGIDSEDEFAPWMERLSDDDVRELEHAVTSDPEEELEPRASKASRARKAKSAAKAKSSDDDVL